MHAARWRLALRLVVTAAVAGMGAYLAHQDHRPWWAAVGWVAFYAAMAWTVTGGSTLRSDQTEPPRPRCSMDVWACKSPAWPSCVDQRCRYHCSMYCKCHPIPERRELRVVRGPAEKA